MLWHFPYLCMCIAFQSKFLRGFIESAFILKALSKNKNKIKDDNSVLPPLKNIYVIYYFPHAL